MLHPRPHWEKPSEEVIASGMLWTTSLSSPLPSVISWSWFKYQSCFVFLVDYSTEPIVQDCEDAGCELSLTCLCSLCKCCTSCSDKCMCLKASSCPDMVVQRILGLGDDRFMYVHFYRSIMLSNATNSNDQVDRLAWMKVTLKVMNTLLPF